MAERCEWNPKRNVASTSLPSDGDCPNPATVSVGADGVYHLCDSCAVLPAFKRYRVRRPLQQSEKS